MAQALSLPEREGVASRRNFFKAAVRTQRNREVTTTDGVKEGKEHLTAENDLDGNDASGHLMRETVAQRSSLVAVSTPLKNKASGIGLSPAKKRRVTFATSSPYKNDHAEDEYKLSGALEAIKSLKKTKKNINRATSRVGHAAMSKKTAASKKRGGGHKGDAANSKAGAKKRPIDEETLLNSERQDDDWCQAMEKYGQETDTVRSDMIKIFRRTGPSLLPQRQDNGSVASQKAAIDKSAPYAYAGERVEHERPMEEAHADEEHADEVPIDNGVHWVDVDNVPYQSPLAPPSPASLNYEDNDDDDQYDLEEGEGKHNGEHEEQRSANAERSVERAATELGQESYERVGNENNDGEEERQGHSNRKVNAKQRVVHEKTKTELVNIPTRMQSIELGEFAGRKESPELGETTQAAFARSHVASFLETPRLHGKSPRRILRQPSFAAAGPPQQLAISTGRRPEATPGSTNQLKDRNVPFSSPLFPRQDSHGTNRTQRPSLIGDSSQSESDGHDDHVILASSRPCEVLVGQRNRSPLRNSQTTKMSTAAVRKLYKAMGSEAFTGEGQKKWEKAVMAEFPQPANTDASRRILKHLYFLRKKVKEIPQAPWIDQQKRWLDQANNKNDILKLVAEVEHHVMNIAHYRLAPVGDSCRASNDKPVLRAAYVEDLLMWVVPMMTSVMWHTFALGGVEASLEKGSIDLASDGVFITPVLRMVSIMAAWIARLQNCVVLELNTRKMIKKKKLELMQRNRDRVLGHAKQIRRLAEEGLQKMGEKSDIAKKAAEKRIDLTQRTKAWMEHEAARIESETSARKRQWSAMCASTASLAQDRSQGALAKAWLSAQEVCSPFTALVQRHYHGSLARKASVGAVDPETAGQQRLEARWRQREQQEQSTREEAPVRQEKERLLQEWRSEAEKARRIKEVMEARTSQLRLSYRSISQLGLTINTNRASEQVHMALERETQRSREALAQKNAAFANFWATQWAR